LSLLLIVIVLGGILGGIFTATEAAAIAVVYAFILAVVVYREVKLREIPGILLQCGITTAVVMFLIATSSAMSWIMATQNIPQNVSAALLSVSESKIIILLIINLLLLFVGTFMDMTPAVLIFTPIFLPIAKQLGMHPVHFGLIMIANLCIGLCTPPVGTCLFVGCGVGHTTISKIARPLLPFLAAMVAALMLVTYIPQLSLFIPKLLKLINA
jgi:tripartite ATP-independent transporter DctM subunit